MHIRTIPYAHVSADHAQVQAQQTTSHPTTRSQRFNTAHHTRAEILSTVPETPSFTHEQPPWTAYGYVAWHPLIARSQNLHDSHVFTLPGFLYDDLMRCHAAWVSTNRFPPRLIADTVELWRGTRCGRALVPVLDGERKWFVRLDQMSPKDSPFGGGGPCLSFEDVVVRLCSSMRAWGCLQREKEGAERDGREVRMQVVLNPWDADMDSASEFRVFVPPPLAAGAKGGGVAGLRVSAVSQYCWHSLFAFPCGFALERTAGLVCAGADAVLVDIRAFVEDEMSEEVRGLLLRHGFSFDVALQQDGSVQLVEVNPFGALSGCGACLFNWVSDGRVLYGLERDVELVVTLDDAYGQGFVGE